MSEPQAIRNNAFFTWSVADKEEHDQLGLTEAP